MHRFSAFAAGLLALGILVGLWQQNAEQVARVDIANQAWVDRRPTSPKDMVNWLFVLELRDGRVGAVQRSSAFRFVGERFRWSRQGKRITMTFPQSDRKITVNARAYKCKAGVFELCLDLEREGRKVTLYSLRDWRIPQQGHPDLPAVSVRPVEGDCVRCVDGVPAALEPLLE